MISIVKRHSYPWICWSLAAIVYFIQYGLMVFPSAVPLEIKSTLGISSTQLGVFSSAFLYTFVLMQIPAGLMFDHFGSKNLLFYSTLLLALGCVVTGATSSYPVALVGRLLMGVGGSFSFIGAVYLARTWFPILLFPIIVGTTEALSGFGEIGVPSIFAVIRDFQSWRIVLLEAAVVIVVLAFLIKMYVRDRKRVSDKHKVNLKKDLIRTLKNKNLWLIGLFTGFIYTHFMVMTDMWGILFLRLRYNIGVGEALFENSLVIAGYTVGCCLVGYFVKYISSQRLLLIYSVVVFCVHLVLTFYYVNLFLESILLFTLGFATSAVVLSYDLAEKIVPSTSYGVAAGFITMFFGLIGMLIVPVVGLLSHYLVLDVYLASFPVVICSAIAVMIALRINIRAN